MYIFSDLSFFKNIVFLRMKYSKVENTPGHNTYIAYHQNNLYAAIPFTSTTTFGGITKVNSSPVDLAVAKLSTDGDWIWVIQGSIRQSTNRIRITTDTNGNCYVCGIYNTNPAIFGNTSLSSNLALKPFIAKVKTYE